MPPVDTQAAPASSLDRTTRSSSQQEHDALWALETIEKHVLLDGFRIVVDLERSRGSYLYDAATGHRLIDFYGFFGSMTVGFNHPHFDDPEVQAELLIAARTKIANSDVYSQAYAEFVDTLASVAGYPPLDRYLFIEGGALAIENCLKAAMDWKVRKNIAAGRGPARNAAHSAAGGDKNIHMFGSRSEQRLGVFWLKLNEIHFYEEILKKRPILLLDDIFSELDIKNKKLVLDLIKQYQTVLTTTEIELLDLADMPKTVINL